MNQGESTTRTISICCYRLEVTEEQQHVLGSGEQGPMLHYGQHSKIKFGQGLRVCKQPIYSLLNRLYEDTNNNKDIIKLLRTKRVNPVIFPAISDRDDLQYYIPQLITYIVIECNLQNQQLNNLILQACMTDFYFAHSVLFYLESLSWTTNGGIVNKVRNFLDNQFLTKMRMYSNCRLSGHQLLLNSQIQYHSINLKNPCEVQIRKQRKGYGMQVPYIPDPATEVVNKDFCEQNFLATPRFWFELIEIGEEFSKVPPINKSDFLNQLLQTRINPKLPASVYVPFFKEQIRLYTILSIKKGMIFSTKERSPYSIYIQIYSQQQQQIIQEESIEESEAKDIKKKKVKFLQRIYETISRPFTAAQGKNTLNIKKIFSDKTQNNKNNEINVRGLNYNSYHYDANHLQPAKERKHSLSLAYESSSQQSVYQSQAQEKSFNINKEEVIDKKYFPKKFQIFKEQYRGNSAYRNLKSWKLLHVMVKIGDDLKQQQFAMQLIDRFQYIFNKQEIDLILFPYSVVSLGPDCGIIEMINDITTLNSLFEKLSLQRKSLVDFFQTQFPDKQKAKKNFMKSLAAYSLVTYFLQVKDRHNGNILLHRDGYIIHIDFGFLLSNAPGKGVELEKNVPFKLLSQYVEVLGSINSELFFQFRKYFYRGFRAVMKNKGIIISLVKMMYKSYGESMACFKKGEEAIESLVERLNPPHNLQNFCYELINSSLDHWRARWYDKFQYFLQKIYY